MKRMTTIGADVLFEDDALVTLNLPQVVVDPNQVLGSESHVLFVEELQNEMSPYDACPSMT